MYYGYLFQLFMIGCTVYTYSKSLRGEFMSGEDISENQKLAYVQFIAEIALIANLKSSELKLALTLIADLANKKGAEHADSIFYEAK